MLDVSKEDELFRLTIESQAINVRIIELMTKGTTVIQQEQPIQEVMINGMENK